MASVIEEKAGEFDVDYELTRLLRRSRVRGLKRAAELHESLDFTSYLLLMAIHDDDGLHGSDLAESFGVHKSTISRSISTLEKLGLVERVADPYDGRAQLLTASVDAARRIDEMRERGQGWLAEILAEWSIAERTAFANGLARFNAVAEQNPIN